MLAARVPAGRFHVRGTIVADDLCVRERRSAARVVSFESERLILVDEMDREIGSLGKLDCHTGSGRLHRAFSLFIFNGRGELLLQQRSGAKRLWPLYWSNSCCSHPRVGESVLDAAHRRLHEELGLDCPLRFLFKFQYQAQFDASSAEHELCSVLVGRSDDAVHANGNEIAAWRWIEPAQLDIEVARSSAAAPPSQLTPWFVLEWRRLRRQHRPELAALLEPRAWASR
jgi:isopentenyl-diphosphate delta-isomerase